MSADAGEVTVYVGAGSNIEPEKNLRLALAELAARYGELTCSSVYRTRAVGFEGADFLNMVVAFRTGQSPEAINAELEKIHDLAGRRRGEGRFSNRTLDLDLLLYGDRVSRPPAPELPRPDVRRYAFVLAPLAELAPDLRHPETGETMRAIWAGFDTEESPVRVMDRATLEAG